MAKTNPANSQRRSAYLSATSPKGSILILALWSITMLSVFCVILGYGVRQKMALVKRFDHRSELRLIAEAGVKRAAVEVKKAFGGEEKSYSILSEPWSSNEAVFKDVRVGGGSFSVRYEYRDEVSGRMVRRYGLSDEESKININKARRIVLERLFKILLNFGEMEAQDLAASIVDWRDADSELSLPTGSAEDSYYRNLENPYEAKDLDFEVLDELLLVKGIDADIFERLKDCVTIYGDGKVNINTASKCVLWAFGLNEDIVDKIIAYRAGKDETAGTADDGIFDTPASIVPKLSQAYPLSESDVAHLTSVVEQYLTTASSNFRIYSVARLGAKGEMTATSVVNKYGRVLYWREF